jgi:hypothetical protein
MYFWFYFHFCSFGNSTKEKDPSCGGKNTGLDAKPPEFIVLP